MRYIKKYSEMEYWEKYYECELWEVFVKIKWKEYKDENCQKLFEEMYEKWKFYVDKRKAIKNHINNLQNKIDELNKYIISLEEELKKAS